MRKVLAGVLCAIVAAVPAVAFAATNHDNGNENVSPPSNTSSVELRQDAKRKLDAALERAKRERRRAIARKRARRLAKQQAAPQGSTPVPASGGGSTAPAGLQAIAACESGGSSGAVGGGGAYRGKYQFDQATWQSVGGSGDPAAASETEQDRRAAMLYARVGASAWPTCGQ